MTNQALKFKVCNSNRSFFISSDGKHELQFDDKFPLRITCTRFNYDRHIAPNFHDYLEIAYIYEGIARIIVEDREYPIQKGDLVIIGSNIIHTIESYYKKPADIVWLAFLPQLIFSPGNTELDFEYLRFFYEQHNNFLITAQNLNLRIPELMSWMFQQFRNKQRHYQIKVKTGLYELLSLLLQYYDKFENIEHIENDHYLQDEIRIKRVFKLVSSNYKQKISLDQAAYVACLSKHYFCKVFKRVTGYTFLEYVLRKRIDKAKELLLAGRYTVSEIAYEVGFENLSYFYRVFRRFNHLNPREFVQRMYSL